MSEEKVERLFGNKDAYEDIMEKTFGGTVTEGHHWSSIKEIMLKLSKSEPDKKYNTITLNHFLLFMILFRIRKRVELTSKEKEAEKRLLAILR